ncbi:GNAT family N-acetyltransferase [Kitasatospora phosalacinea]|uniref:GNAT family N-acetyltransferase n=1 Tax=Kitasatospora phosalacinea TaxID=2065 RepID=UPI0005248CE1|nr:GNAT family N-acetyltransferase [Kitasatospora phosalacinea]
MDSAPPARPTVRPSGPAPVLRPGDVPERLDAEGLVVRRWRAGEAGARYRMITASFAHLHPWMGWADRLPTEPEHAERFARSLAWPNAGGSYAFGVFAADDRTPLGMVGLHDQRGGGAVEIGYWCHVDHLGRGVATRAARALTGLLTGLPAVERVEIRCDEANLRSAEVARRLGYRLERIEEDGVRAPAESGRGMVWVKERPAP